MRRASISTLDRRSFLEAAGRLGKAAAAGSMLSLGPSTLGYPALAHAKTQALEPLIKPAEIRSANGVLDATITAAPGPVQL